MHLVLAISPASRYPAGAADGSLKVWDKRKLGPDGGSALFTFNHHTGAVLRAEWSPSAPGELHMPTHQDLLCSPSLQQTWPHITCQHIKICLAALPCSISCHISHVNASRLAWRPILAAKLVTYHMCPPAGLHNLPAFSGCFVCKGLAVSKF